MQVFYLLGTEGQTFLLVVFLQVLNVLDGFRLDVDGEDALVQTVVHTLQHLVVLGVLAVNGKVLLDTADAFQTHVLGNLHGIGRPWRDHLAARTDKVAGQTVAVCQLCVAVEPA